MKFKLMIGLLLVSNIASAEPFCGFEIVNDNYCNGIYRQKQCPQTELIKYYKNLQGCVTQEEFRFISKPIEDYKQGSNLITSDDYRKEANKIDAKELNDTKINNIFHRFNQEGVCDPEQQYKGNLIFINISTSGWRVKK